MHSREIIQQSNLSNVELSEHFEINEKTVSKWKNRDHLVDKSSRPHTIKCSLTDMESKEWGQVQNYASPLLFNS